MSGEPRAKADWEAFSPNFRQDNLLPSVHRYDTIDLDLRKKDIPSSREQTGSCYVVLEDVLRYPTFDVVLSGAFQ
jgi:hypothetical protein